MIEHLPLAAAGSVSTVLHAGIADVCFGHPKSNSLPASVLRGLADHIAKAGARTDVRVVLLRSYGTATFCAGASFDELTAITDPMAGQEFFMGFARVILAMARCPKPIVTRVHGKVVGGGVGIVAASDYAVALDRASLRLSELAIGIGPFVVGPVIERKIGSGALAAMSLDADWRDASWAATHGLYARLADSVAALDATVGAVARRLAAANPEAVAQIKANAWTGIDAWETLLSERAAMSGRMVLSDYAREAIANFA